MLGQVGADLPTAAPAEIGYPIDIRNRANIQKYMMILSLMNDLCMIPAKKLPLLFQTVL
jgi:hypothetical protein